MFATWIAQGIADTLRRLPVLGAGAGAERRAHDDAPAGLPALPAESDDGDAAHGCGWFDSSHDLRAGLVVCEHASADAVAQDLPVAFWLELHLREWQGAARGGPGLPG